MEACPDLLKVLSMYPQYGVSIPGHQNLRKMRLKAPGLKAGKSGGYRLIYRVQEMDESLHFVLLEVYFKSDREDLESEEYETLQAEAQAILSQPMIYDWAEVSTL